MVDLQRVGRAARGTAGIVRRRSVQPPIRFLVLTPGRAGSTLLTTLLGSVPGVRCDEEALGSARGDPTSLLARRAARAAFGDVQAWGSSVHPEHLFTTSVRDPVDWVGALHDDGYELITLVRLNPLAISLSSLVADQKGAWHFVEGHDARDRATAKVLLDPMLVLQMAIQSERSTEDVRRWVAERSHLALVYEDDLREPDRHQATADRVLRYLGLPTAPVTSPLQRRPVPLLEQIENVDEVAAVLRPTRFGPMLADIDR